MELLSKIKQAIICLLAGKCTLAYPAEPRTPEKGFRGYPHVDVDACIGCGGCAAVCPARLIKINDINQETRRMTWLLERCIFCGRCEEVCPEQAISMTQKFELASDRVRDDMVAEYDIFMATCRRCGRCYTNPNPLDRIMHTGMRRDSIDRGGANCAYGQVCPTDVDAEVEDAEEEEAGTEMSVSAGGRNA